MPALPLDAALVHLNRADARGNATFLGPDLYFDDLFCQAAEKAYLSCERIVPTAELGEADLTRQRIARWMVSGVVEAPNGAHFTSCAPDYERDESFQKEYATAAKDPDAWAQFRATYLDVARRARLPGRRRRPEPRHALPRRRPRERHPRRGLRDRLRRGLPGRRRDPGQPDGADPLAGCPARARDVRAGPAAVRRRGVLRRRRVAARRTAAGHASRPTSPIGRSSTWSGPGAAT